MLKLASHSEFPIASALSLHVGEALLPYSRLVNRLKECEDLVIATDFSESQNNKWHTAGVLLASRSDLMKWQATSRQMWRGNYRYPGQSIGYKKFRNKDADLQDLATFLTAASQLPGILVTGTVPSLPKYIFTKKGDAANHPDLSDFRSWNDPDFEALVRFSSFLAAAIAPIASSDASIQWLCDPDNLIASIDRKASTPRFVGMFVSVLCDTFRLPELHEPPQSKEHISRLPMEDILALPDIAAGGMGEFIGTSHHFYGSHGLDVNEGLPQPPGTKEKASQVAKWFGYVGGPLVRIALAVDPNNRQAIRFPISLARA